MAKSYENLITEARELLQDTDTPFRFTDSYMLNTLNRGLQELGRIRPDAFYDLYDANALNIPEIVDDDAAIAPQYDWATTFQINMHYFTPLMTYVIGSIEATDDEFTLEGRAMMFLQSFRSTVIGI